MTPSSVFRVLLHGRAGSCEPVGGQLSTSRSIGEALAHDAFQSSISARAVINAEAQAVVVPKVKFSQVAVQMLLCAVLVNSVHAALKHAKVTLDGVGVDFAPHVFLDAVVDGFVLGQGGAGPVIDAGFVSHQAGLFGHILHDDLGGSSTIASRNVEAADAATALNQGNHGALVAVAAPLGAALFAADIRFVGFHDGTFAAHRLHADSAQRLAQTVRHEPSGLYGHAEGAMQLVAADTLLAGAHQMHGLEPQVHFDMAGLEHRSDLGGKGLHAGVALPQTNARGLATKFADALSAAVAMRADWAIRPDARFEESKSSFLVLEMLGGEDRLGHREASYVF